MTLRARIACLYMDFVVLYKGMAESANFDKNGGLFHGTGCDNVSGICGYV